MPCNTVAAGTLCRISRQYTVHQLCTLCKLGGLADQGFHQVVEQPQHPGEQGQGVGDRNLGQPQVLETRHTLALLGDAACLPPKGTVLLQWCASYLEICSLASSPNYQMSDRVQREHSCWSGGCVYALVPIMTTIFCSSMALNH